MEEEKFEWDEDDLEYHITFPPSREKSGDIEPLVFLFGWGGISQECLFDLGKQYNNGGCIAISYVPPLKYNYLDSSQLRPIAQKLLDMMEEMALEKNPIFIHSFSTLGASMLQCFLEAINKDPQKKHNLKGRILDSSPSRFSVKSFIRLTQQIMEPDSRPSGIFFYLTPLIILLYSLIISFKAKVTSLLCGSWAPPASPYNWMIESESRPEVPYLFLYSKEDRIAFFKDIEELIQVKAGMGCTVRQISYDSGPHAEHFVRNKNSYMASVMSFVQESILPK